MSKFANTHYEIPVGTSLTYAKRLLVEQAMELTDGNKVEAAKLLKMSRSALYQCLKIKPPLTQAPEDPNQGKLFPDSLLEGLVEVKPETPAP